MKTFSLARLKILCPVERKKEGNLREVNKRRNKKKRKKQKRER